MDLLRRARDLVPPLAVVEASEGTLIVKARDENGFDVSFKRADGRWIVSVGPWLGHFDDTDEALECFRGALSPNAFLVVAYRGSFAVRTDVHWPSGMVSTSGSMFSPFWRSKSAAIRRNHWSTVQDDE